MKSKSIFAIVVIATIFMLGTTSCKKEYIIIAASRNITIATDMPPESVFKAGNIPYMQVRTVILSKVTMDSAKTYPFACNQWYDNNSNQWLSSDCGIWHLVPVKPYWGQTVSNGDTTTYIGNAVIWCAVNPNNWILTGEFIKTTGQASGNVNWWGGNSWEMNPIGASQTLFDIKGR